MTVQNKLTPHFTLEEARTTSTGLSNIPNKEESARILNTAYQMEIVRAILQRKPIKVNSWFRSEAVNSTVGGSPRSEHRLGAAVDFTCAAFGSPAEVAKTLMMYAHILNYNQLIYENTWVHISFPPDGHTGLRQVLTYTKGKYIPGVIV